MHPKSEADHGRQHRHFDTLSRVHGRIDGSSRGKCRWSGTVVADSRELALPSRSTPTTASLDMDLKPHRLCRFPDRLGIISEAWIVRIAQQGDGGKRGDRLAQKLQRLQFQFRSNERHASRVAARPRQARDETGRDRIAANDKDDRNGVRRGLCGAGRQSELTLTSNCSAASRRDPPPSTKRMTRTLSSPGYGPCIGQPSGESMPYTISGS